MKMYAGLILGVLTLALPVVAWAAPDDAGAQQESEAAQSGSRDASRRILLGGMGVPDVMFIEADYVVGPALAITARAGGFPPLLGRFSAGFLGLVPLSSDTALVRRHALGLQAELSAIAVINLAGDDRVSRPGEGLVQRDFHTTIGPTVSAGYLYTLPNGDHLRLMGGAFFPVSGDLSTPLVNVQLGLGRLL